MEGRFLLWSLRFEVRGGFVRESGNIGWVPRELPC